MLQGKIHRVIHNRNGFALLDVLLGIAILSVALFGIAFAWCRRFQHKSLSISLSFSWLMRKRCFV